MDKEKGGGAKGADSETQGGTEEEGELEADMNPNAFSSLREL